jgi:hypothetical protein
MPVNQISVRGTILAFPKMCCCCGSEKAKKRYTAGATYVGRWINTKYREKRWWEVPICKGCHQWVRASQSADRWFPQFLIAVILGAVAVVPAALAGFQPIAGLTFGFIALALLAYSSLAFPLWRFRRAQARRLDPGPPCDPYPVLLTDWLGVKHTFRFSNPDFFQRFAVLNRDNIV